MPYYTIKCGPQFVRFCPVAIDWCPVTVGQVTAWCVPYLADGIKWDVTLHEKPQMLLTWACDVHELCDLAFTCMAHRFSLDGWEVVPFR